MCRYCGAFTTMYSVLVPENCGWYHDDPHCMYVAPLTTVVTQSDGNV